MLAVLGSEGSGMQKREGRNKRRWKEAEILDRPVVKGLFRSLCAAGWQPLPLQATARAMQGQHDVLRCLTIVAGDIGKRGGLNREKLRRKKV